MQSNFSIVSWAKSAVLYEVNIRQFTVEGTFKAFQKHLPRLKNMGVDALWLMPITPISEFKKQGNLGSYYACSSYTKINPEFGSLEDFRDLIKQAHQLGLKVIIDWVANHTGCDHEWTISNPDYYILDENNNFTERNGWKDVIDLNFNNASMRIAMINAMKYWVNECDIDGFRCDMAHLVALDFWKTARIDCDELKKLFWLAECDEEKYLTVFDASYAWEWMHLTEKLVKQQVNIEEIIINLQQYLKFENTKLKLFFTSNHDENSWNGTEFEKYGNLAKAFAVLTFTWNGMPLIYSGQEIPSNKRLKFFDKDVLLWDNTLKLETFYQTLISLFHESGFNQASIEILPTDNTTSILSFIKVFDNKIWIIILNLSKHDRIHFNINHPHLQGQFEQVFSKLIFNFNAQENFELMAGDYLVFRKL
ncbi:MAG: 1,4-alpha-glucan branching protein [Chitinophagaceae bacterium]|nr:1,4-alpha-glucan branching protein [Chitinophagaceae bacterium]